ncbi:MAG: alanine racemase [Oscillospiraceae bacterium]
MNTYPYRTYAEIDLNKMQHNLRQVRAAIGPDCKLLFVLKADAYGHGTPVCAKYSEELVDWYAVATIDEALSIRRAGVEKPILLFGALQDPEIELAADNRITINSCSLEYSRHVAEVLQRCGKRMDCHIKIDTGMNRTGLFARVGRTDGAVRQAEEIFALEPLHVTGIYTHFSCADSADPEDVAFTQRQYEAFAAVAEALQEKGYDVGAAALHEHVPVFVPPGVEARYDPRWNAGLWAEHGRGVGSQNGSQAHHALVREGRIRA